MNTAWNYKMYAVICDLSVYVTYNTQVGLLMSFITPQNDTYSGIPSVLDPFILLLCCEVYHYLAHYKNVTEPKLFSAHIQTVSG